MVLIDMPSGLLICESMAFKIVVFINIKLKSKSTLVMFSICILVSAVVKTSTATDNSPSRVVAVVESRFVKVDFLITLSRFVSECHFYRRRQ